MRSVSKKKNYSRRFSKKRNRCSMHKKHTIKKHKSYKGGGKIINLEQYMYYMPIANKKFEGYEIDNKVVEKLETFVKTFLADVADSMKLLKKNENDDKWKLRLFINKNIPYKTKDVYDDKFNVDVRVQSRTGWYQVNKDNPPVYETPGSIFNQTIISDIMKCNNDKICTPQRIEYLAYTVDFILLTILIKLCDNARKRNKTIVTIDDFDETFKKQSQQEAYQFLMSMNRLNNNRNLGIKEETTNHTDNKKLDGPKLFRKGNPDIDKHIASFLRSKQSDSD
jgi:hypothetical protein